MPPDCGGCCDIQFVLTWKSELIFATNSHARSTWRSWDGSPSWVLRSNYQTFPSEEAKWTPNTLKAEGGSCSYCTGTIVMTTRAHHYWVALSRRVTGWAGQISSLRSLWFMRGADLIKILCHHPEKEGSAFPTPNAHFCAHQNSSLNPRRENADGTGEMETILNRRWSEVEGRSKVCLEGSQMLPGQKYDSVSFSRWGQW